MQPTQFSLLKVRSPKAEARRIRRFDKMIAISEALRVSFGISSVEGMHSAQRLLSQGKKPQVIKPAKKGG